MNSNQKKALFIGAIIFIAGISVGIFFLEKYKGGQYDVRIGYLEGDLHHLAFYVARENGYYADEGLNIQDIAFANGGEVMTAFESASRSIDISYLGLAPALYHRFNNPSANVKILAGVNVNGSALIVKDDNSIQTAADLERLTIAVPARHNMQDFILSMILDQANLNHTDISVVVQGPSDMILALQNGDIDGYVAWEPYNVKGTTEEIGGKYLFNSSQVWKNHPCCIIASHEEFLNSDPEIVQKVIKVHKRTTIWILEHWEEAKQIAMEKMNLTEEQAENAMANIGYVYENNIGQMVTFVDKLVELNPDVSMDSENIPNGLNSTTFIDWFVNGTYLENLED